MKGKTTATTLPRTGDLIVRVLQARQMRKADLARKLHAKNSIVNRFTNSNSMSLAKLAEISRLLGHNFFADLAATLPSDFTTLAAEDPFSEERARLQAEIARLQAENALMERLLRDR